MPMHFTLDLPVDGPAVVEITPLPMTEITPEDLRVKAKSVTDPMVVRMLSEAADAIEILRSEAATLRSELSLMVKD